MQEQYLLDHSLIGIPSLSDMFSLTTYSTKGENQEAMIQNDRIIFWEASLANGLEAQHACTSLFKTLFAVPNPSYASFDLILNPNDRPAPSDYERSASNIDCVTSLIVGLSIHPSVLSVESDVPAYHGWTVAYAFDSS